MSVMSESRRSQSSIALSTLTRLTTFVNFTDEQKITAIRETFLFPLFTEISRFGHIPRIIYTIQFLILIFQELGVSIWAGSILISDEYSILRGVYVFTDLNMIRTPNFLDLVPQYLTGYAIFLFTNLFLVFISLYYQNKRTFNRWHLIILRFLLYPLLGTVLPLYGIYIGRSFCEIIVNGASASSVAFFVTSIPMYIISIIEFKYVNQFSTDTPVIDRSIFASWNDRIIYLTVFSISLAAMVSSILSVFPKWLNIAAIIGYLIFLFYRMYYLYFIPMLRFSFNSYLMGLCIMSIFNCIMSIVHLFTNFLPVYIYPASGFLVFILASCFCYRWYCLKRDSCCSALSYSNIGDGKPDDNAKREHFDTLIFSSANDALTYMHIGVAFQADSILDFSFLRYLMDNYAEPDIIFAVAKVTAFFPAELQFLSYCLSIVSKFTETTLAQDFLIYQMRRIHVVRQSSVSADASSQLGILQKMSRDTISQVRGFWSEILNAKSDISFASLNYIRKVTLKTDTAFLDACDRFPNNVSIMNEYCRFQIEAMGNFSGAVSSGKKMLLLDQGKNLTIDHAFRSLVNIYPEYLLNNIFNIHGNLVQKGLLTESSTGSISSSNSSQEEFEEKYEEIVSQLYRHGKLRVALQTRMKSTRLNSLYLAQVLSIVQLISCIFIYILIMSVLPIIRDTAKSFILAGSMVSRVSITFNYISCIAGIQSAYGVRSFAGAYYLRTLLGVYINDVKVTPSMLIDVYKLVNRLSAILKDSFDILTRLIMSCMHSSIDELHIFIDVNTEFLQSINRTQDLTMRASLSMVMYFIELYGLYVFAPDTGNAKEAGAEIISNSNSISKAFQLLQITLNEKGEEIIDAQKNLIIAIFILVISGGFILFISFRIYYIVMIFKEAKQCSDLLRKVNPSLIVESYKPIALKGTRESIRGNNIHSAHEMNVLMVVYPIVIVLSIMLTVALAISSSLYFSKRIDIVKLIFKWFSYNNIRVSSLMGAFVTYCARSTDVLTEEEAVNLLNGHIEALRTAHNKMDVLLMGIDEKFDKMYYTKECPQFSPQTRSPYASHIDCLSINNRLNIASDSIQSQIEDNLSFLNTPEFGAIVYLLDIHLYDDLMQFQYLMANYTLDRFQTASSRTNSMCISGLIICCLVFLLEQFFIRTFIQSVDAIKQLILMLPPVSVATTSFLMDFINNGNKNEDKEITMTASESILSATSCAAVMLDNKFIIQAVNKSVNEITGFTPDQILGRKVTWLIPEPSYETGPNVKLNEKFYSALNRMITNENEEKYVVLNIKCMTENGMIIPSVATILYLPDVESGNDQFALLLRDLSKETELVKALQKAKSRTNKLLRSLIPKDVSNQERVFYSDEATVIMIEVSGLTEYVHTLSPQQLMQNLKTVYDGFEQIAAGFPAISILKMNVEQFVAISGMFSYHCDRREQAIQAVYFCSKMLEEVENINEELDIDLHLRIGINAGGPIIGSLLDQMMPTFEIFGDFVELAHRMQVEGEIGVIQVGEQVAKHLQPMDFEVRKGVPVICSFGMIEQIYTVKVLSRVVVNT
ncbi:hypothetical protein TRFO_35724 [Tritrichomonas foetus]|uniref:Adenylate and Guanylate cyclase catalytic domain containing protein n=1 Tax=Tritrichomonas foetus TaxID=1144522 RepID=A0A1J4JL13_9EUKA|nr:hypothetical protein TRFO_35724 [Tritrichomonas foetus]|eukprot:OHS97956.1 hypothetical protein TRFO_35724 [Tritrichomonas foetus]